MVFRAGCIIFWGGHASFFWGACIIFSGGRALFLGGYASFFRGGAWFFHRDTVNEWAVRILLECILVS